MLWKLFKHLDGQWKDCSNKHLMATQNGSSVIVTHMEKASHPTPPQFEVDVDLGFAVFFLFLLCFFLLVTVVRCAQTVLDPYGSISTSTYQEEQIT
ncbi:Cortexin domain containing 1 [Dissostichus eleginoides]|uniref:Cortexin domain containing 1 n=1 Tax=Dissostichus eleginoides TaxID=100907 RepID=A0AAD9BG08_DISEL|nr:Cortexin domain containing 1 [Dissostichus eleginoides]